MTEKTNSAPAVETVEFLKEQLEAERIKAAALAEQLADTNILLEVANERWVEQVNKNSSLELAVRKSTKVK